jgi:release factor glutamine methyltransferase
MTIREILVEAAELARQAGADATVWDARVLLAHCLGGASPLALDLSRELPPAAAERFRELWRRRVVGEPVQHLVGEWDFYGRPFWVDGRALVPRPETELLVSAALREAPRARRMLDAGTGSGNVAVTWLLERPDARALALDVSIEALALAQENAARHRVLDRLGLVASDWVSAIGPARFDLLVSNPPYLSLALRDSISPTVRGYDPHRGLFSGEDGLTAIRHLLDGLPPFLEPDTPFLFEIGYGQAREVEQEARSRPVWRFLRIESDLSGIPRVAVLRRR